MEKPTYKNISLNLDISEAYKKQAGKKISIILFGLLILLAVTLLDLFISNSFSDPIKLIITLLDGTDSNANLVIFNLRMPHVLCSLLSGATLGICGCILQSCLNNPLASPSTIGVSQGASFGACLAIIVFSAFGINFNWITILCAFIFGVIPVFIIYSLSKKFKFNATTIILVGVSMSIFFGGLIALVEYFADSSKIAEVLFWTFGNVHNINYVQLFIIAVVLIIVLIISMLNSINFNALTTGDITAHSIGINIKSFRLIFLILSALACSCVTAFCGTINFIGLLAPHIMKQFVGLNHKYLIPSSAIGGAILLTLSDLLSSIILPGAILPIGAITSLIGAPVFIWMLIKGKN